MSRFDFIAAVIRQGIVLIAAAILVVCGCGFFASTVFDVRTGGSCQNLFIRPSGPESVVNASQRPIENFCPIGYAMRNAVQGQDMSASLVSGLLSPCRPSTVSRFVVAAVVDSVDRMFCTRLWPHIRKKTSEGLTPLLTNGNPTSTIMFVRWRIWIHTSIEHTSPGSIFRCVFAFAGMTMNEVHGAYNTAARVYVSISKVVSNYNMFVSAVADASPLKMVMLVGANKSDNEKASETLANKINGLRHCYRSCNERIAGIKRRAVAAIATFGSYPSHADYSIVI